MRIGFIGLGKLGLPVALAIESKGHTVIGYDVNPAIHKYLENKQLPYKEMDIAPLLAVTKIKLAAIDEVISNSDIVFMPIQTPHDPMFEGTSQLSDERKDFDYSFLLDAIRSVVESATRQNKSTLLAVISTCLPGTYDEKIKPLLNEYVQYVYTPQFIAMGTVLNDYLDPEFSLIGVEDKAAASILSDFYMTLYDKPNITTDIITAEGIKVSYNTWITAKTVIANIWGEISYKTGMNFDDIFKAWSLSTKRLVSTKYMQAGMSDGGGCHPRDNIAMSWLARKLDLSHDIFEDLMYARQDFEAWHAEVAATTARESHLPLFILGRAFKPETNIETGSPAILMSNLTNYEHKHVDEIQGDGVYFVAVGDTKYATGYTDKSVVIDPFGFVSHQNVIKLGRK